MPSKSRAGCSDDRVARSARVLRLPEVLNLVSLSRKKLYELIRQGRFPKQVRLGARSVGWREAEIEQWLASRSHAGRNEDA